MLFYPFVFHCILERNEIPKSIIPKIVTRGNSIGINIHTIKLIIGTPFVKPFLCAKKVINVNPCNTSSNAKITYRLENTICKYDVGSTFMKVDSKINMT
jgi:hypothetical protein